MTENTQFLLVETGGDPRESWKAYQGFTDKQIETGLVDQMMSDLEALGGDPLPHITTVMKEPNNKWRVVSGMQKAIRQSDVKNAVRLATALHNSTEQDTLWRRLAVVGLEDIGVANLPLAALTFAVAGKKAWREANGGVAIPKYLAYTAALTLKDRSACNLACWVGAEAQWDYSKVPFEDVDSMDLLGRASWLRVNAVGISNDKREVIIPPNKKKAEAYVERLPTLMQYVFRRGKSAGVESLFTSAALIVDALEDVESDDFDVVKRPPLESPLIKGVPAYAFDKHTYEGKKAYAYFLKACKPIADWEGWPSNMSYQLKMRCLGSAIFYAEGGEYLVDRLVYPIGLYISKMELAAFAKRYMLTPQQFRDLHQLVSDNLGALNNARGKVMQSG